MIYILFAYDSYYPSGGADDIESWQENAGYKEGSDVYAIRFFGSIIKARIDSAKAGNKRPLLHEWWDLVKLDTNAAIKTTIAQWRIHHNYGDVPASYHLERLTVSDL